ncbi:MAG: hypothetical protein A3F74_22765 [Betaproteobacteria bacterium RIFCSPLOWO2_12_FULL_62_58]|nr:MAG: hypothetical protein A3F74_22765 [Betaproteobacteria bacterium RIFCSPLOWO2_12_FULL_62_58]
MSTDDGEGGVLLLLGINHARSLYEADLAKHDIQQRLGLRQYNIGCERAARGQNGVTGDLIDR